MRKSRLYPLILVAIMTALATVVYMFFPEIPLVPGVSHLKVDLSDIPALITALTIGPWYGVLVEIFKNCIHLFRTTTLGIGELMNICIGTTMMVSMWLFSNLFSKVFKKGGKCFAGSYYIAATITVIITIIVGWLLNLSLTPIFYKVMHFPLTTATLMAGVWGSTLLNAVKSAITILPIWPIIRVLQHVAKKYY